MTQIRWVYLKIVIAALVGATIFWGLGVLHLDWRAGHTSLYLINPKINWVGYYADHLWAATTRYFFADNRQGLPPVRLYVPARSQHALMKRLPDTAKKWRQAYRLYEDDVLKPVKVRHRGDNPFNWMFAKKSWRVKTKKSAMIGGTRVFNYVVPQVLGLNSEHLTMSIARNAGVLAPESRMVELFINDQSMGVYLEFEHLGEGFLRKHGLMPVNLYKGEQYYQERAFRVDHDLFNNPALWKKIAVSNHSPKEDFSDLKMVFELIRDAETSAAALAKLKLLAPYEVWARYAALVTLVNTPHNDSIHNMRVAFDNWRGHLVPIAYDLSIVPSLSRKNSLDFAPHALFRLYHRHSDFLLRKYKILYRLVVQENILKTALSELAALEEKIDISVARDGNLIQDVYFSGTPRESTTPEGSRKDRQILAQRIQAIDRDIRGWIEGPPDLKWQATSMGVALNIGGTIPVGDISLKLMRGRAIPRILAWDVNRNGRLDKQDVPLPFHHVSNGLVIDATWLANRSMQSFERVRANAFFMQLSPQATRFDLIADTALQITAMTASNALTGEQLDVPQGIADGMAVGRWNVPVRELPPATMKRWQGTIAITGTKVIDDPVRMAAGTIIEMSTGANLVFRQRVIVEGTRTNPVVVKPKTDAGPWGVFALQGDATSGSRLKHMRIAGGSGASVDNITYTGMLSIHDTEDIRLDGIIGEANARVDDMIHVVYGRNIVFRDFEFRGALSDAVDIDISTVRFEGGRIVDAGNDAIDLMTSRALISSVDLENSGDKGISVGENSRASVWNVRLHKNAIGIEAKDSSEVNVMHTDFIANAKQINAYAKNWRYGAGGRIAVWKSYFSGAENKLTAKKKSAVSVSDSTINPFPKKRKRISLSANVDGVGGRKARFSGYGSEERYIPKGADLGRFEGVRGAVR
jgi:hypothetical protein